MAELVFRNRIIIYCFITSRIINIKRDRVAKFGLDNINTYYINTYLLINKYLFKKAKHRLR